MNEWGTGQINRLKIDSKCQMFKYRTLVELGRQREGHSEKKLMRWTEPWIECYKVDRERGKRRERERERLTKTWIEIIERY